MSSKRWWETVPALLGGVAAIIAAVGGIVATLLNEPATTTMTTPSISPEPQPSLPTPQKVSTSYNFSLSQLDRLEGADCEMDTDPGDTVNVNFSSRLTHNETEVFLTVKYDAKEYKGNGTKIGRQVTEPIFKAPAGTRIVDLEFPGSSSVQVLNLSAQGRSHGFRSFDTLAGRSFWDSIEYKVDDEGSNDCATAGVRGRASLKVVLTPVKG